MKRIILSIGLLSLLTGSASADGKQKAALELAEYAMQRFGSSAAKQSIVDKQNKHPRLDWHGADMRGANLAGMDLEGVDFRAADLRGVNFSGSMLQNADFRGALVQGANFQNANLYGAKMQGVEADQADFRGADLRYTNFGGAYLQGAMMPVPTTEQKAFKRIFDGVGKEPKAAGKELESGIER